MCGRARCWDFGVAKRQVSGVSKTAVRAKCEAATTPDTYISFLGKILCSHRYIVVTFLHFTVHPFTCFPGRLKKLFKFFKPVEVECLSVNCGELRDVEDVA